jgi:hypothetical protein
MQVRRPVRREGLRPIIVAIEEIRGEPKILEAVAAGLEL